MTDRVREIFHTVVSQIEEGDNLYEVIAALGMSISFFLESLPAGTREDYAQSVCRTMMGTLGRLDDGSDRRLH